MSVDLRVDRSGDGWTATVRVEQRGQRTEHHVTIRDEDVSRYGATDVADLVRRSFEFLLAREPNTQVLREFRITEIERYFPEFREAIGRSRE